ncbi:hypothetical protein DID88_006004 [Monilinia fructigena]|uniref:Uncharacterized protein n=1 Tax=Monilinia fructigena TaxID=38457 RepID=A0A395J2L4_9HELO|nr:hypothetical protein DID88_006004 [Monilinia fructigena]
MALCRLGNLLNCLVRKPDQELVNHLIPFTMSSRSPLPLKWLPRHLLPMMLETLPSPMFVNAQTPEA